MFKVISLCEAELKSYTLLVSIRDDSLEPKKNLVSGNNGGCVRFRQLEKK